MAPRTTSDPVERLIVSLAGKGVHLEVDDKNVVWATGNRENLTDNDRSLIVTYKPVLQALLRDSSRMMRLDPRTDSRAGRRKPRGFDCHVHKSRSFSYCEILAQTCVACDPGRFRSLAPPGLNWVATDYFQDSGHEGLNEEERLSLELHEAEVQRTSTREEVMRRQWKDRA